jgi:hypothetical protein
MGLKEYREASIHIVDWEEEEGKEKGDGKSDTNAIRVRMVLKN